MMDWLRLSYSSLNTFESCARKFELDKFYPHKMVRDDAFAADVGTAIHAGYQNFLVTQDRDAALWAFLESYPYRLEFMEKYDDRSCEAALATLEEMFESVAMLDYELAQIKKPDGTIVPAIEVPFEIRFKGLTIPPTPRYPNGCGVSFVGYIDAILRNLVTDLFRTTDIKTHRRHLRDATAKYKYDSQQVPYGIVVDHVAGQPVEQFEVNYLDCFIDVVEPRVALYPFMKSSDDLQEWLTHRVLQIQQMQQYAQMGFFPRTSGGCLFYNKPCRYLDPCASRDAEVLKAWFLMGESAAQEEDFKPWILTEIDPFGGEQ